MGLCVSCRNGCLGLINGDMFDIQKWGYISVTEMGLCCSYRNGAMF